jgi:signal transduction histidine kinase/CheY-like chemotaxis protein
LNPAEPTRVNQRPALVCGRLTVLLAVLVLGGWTFDVEGLKRFGTASLGAVNPVSACGLLLAGVALLLLQCRDAAGTRKRLGQTAAAIVAALGALKLIALSVGWDFPLERWLWPGQLAGGSDSAGQIPVRSALSFLLVGSALLALDVQTRRGRRPGEILSVIVGVIALLALIAYSYGLVVYYRTSTYVPMSFPEAIAFLLLATGTLLARPDKGAISIIVSDTPAGLLARLLLPLAVFVPLLLGALRRKGTSGGWFSTDLGVALFATVFLVFFFAAIWYTTRRLFRSEMQRKAAEENVRKINAQLEQRVAERTAELHAVNEELRTASKAKDDFLSVLSHELRTPLTPALAASSYLADNLPALPPAEFAEEIDLIRRNIQLEARLIDDLLDLTRISRGKIELHLADTDAHALIRAALGMAAREIADKQLTVSTSLTAAEHQIHGDPIRLQQVFWNLINNAVKFTGAGGQITIATRNDDGGRFTFEITDTGIGIDPERKASLFKAFEQGERSVTRQFGGLGLGLAIAKSLVELHDGSIAVESRGRDQGATFRVTLPVMRSGAAVERPQATSPEATRRPLRILLVEDHEDTRRTLEHILAHSGHHVSPVDSVRPALDLLRSETFDAVLSDIGLPDGSGYEVMSEARRQQPVNGRALTGIALTGFGMEEDVRRSKAAGFDLHLTKPIDFAELRRALTGIGG